MSELEAFGWSPAWAAALGAAEGRELVPGRVVVQHRDRAVLVTAQGELPGIVSGRFRHAAAGPADFPVVGDWVAFERSAGATEAGCGDSRAEVVIQAVLPRRSAFVRRAAGRAPAGQVVAANVDAVLVATSLDRDLNPRRLERYLAVAWESGAAPELVLTKADRCPSGARDALVLQAEAVAAGLRVTVVSAVDGTGLAELAARIMPGRTTALLGSSGVGKSTLINALLGGERQAVADVRAGDGRGRHTTTRRELLRLPGGGLVVDTPGMRELGLWEVDGLDQAFDEVEALAVDCRFRDCRHESEPGCAVRAAVATGRLDPERIRSRRTLGRELAALEASRDPGAKRRFWRAMRDAAAERMAARSDPSLR